MTAVEPAKTKDSDVGRVKYWSSKRAAKLGEMDSGRNATKTDLTEICRHRIDTLASRG